MYMQFQLTVGTLIAMLMASNSAVTVSATLHLRKSMHVDVRQPRKMQTQQTVTASKCDADLAMVSFEYCFYSCGLDEAECEDLIETSSTSTNSTGQVVSNCTNGTAVVAGSGDEGDPMACEPNPSGFDLVAAFLTVDDATSYCSDNCGLDEEECTRWKQRYILAEMQRRL